MLYSWSSRQHLDRVMTNSTNAHEHSVNRAAVPHLITVRIYVTHTEMICPTILCLPAGKGGQSGARGTNANNLGRKHTCYNKNKEQLGRVMNVLHLESLSLYAPA
jgi:hypothetical protein